MTVRNEGLEIAAIKGGKSFFFDAANQTLASGETIDVCIAVKDLELYLRSIIIDSNADQISWQVYAGHEITPGSGTQLGINNRNTAVVAKPDFQAIQDPIITNPGTPIFPVPRVILGQQAFIAASFIYKQILTGGYVISKNTNIRMQFTNDSTGSVALSVLFSARENI